MKAFLVILIYSTLGFAVLFMAMDVFDGNPKSFLEYMEMSYNLDLGNYDAFEDNVRRVMVVSATVISMVIMFNLLISILGDTFGRVQGEME
eukprot:CAMPEP_0168316548 /NCGR_PEP_ID=MMETSP0210-20121227/16390_1 /TAXON_ID=40633 /ORGANISM="Condylostoma magnum, Strain COL2" /LENGTH=90 /DNA_ID=CAMNT_0008298893 /DNA_START=3020 /DNA_END=3292 /DNA_ORIENTATION=-